MRIYDFNIDWCGTLLKRTKTKYIVLHHAAASVCSPEDINRWHKEKGWCGIGYHFFIRKDGKIYRGRPLNTVGSHISGHNFESVGICVEGDYSKETTMPQKQLKSVKEAIKIVKSQYGNLPVKAHRELASSACPGKYYPLETIRNNEEEMTMDQYKELCDKLDDIRADIADLKVKTGCYNYIDNNMPAAYRPTIQKLVNMGVLKGNEKGELMLTSDQMRTLTVLDRLGLIKDA